MDIERTLVLTRRTTMKRQRVTRILARRGAKVLFRNATFLLLVSAGLFVGCKQGRGDRCQQDSDCGSGLVCGASCSLTTSSCTCEPVVGVGTGGTTVVSTGGTSGPGGTGAGGSTGTGGVSDQGGAAGGDMSASGGGSGDNGGAAGQGAGGLGGGDLGAGGGAGSGAAGAAAGGAGGA